MQIHQIDAIRAELLEGRLERLDDLVMLVHPWLGVVDLGRQREAPLLPFGFPRECLLLLANVDACRVQLVVAARLQDVERPVELAHVRDTRAVGFRRPEGHQTQDYPVCGTGRDERHVWQLGLGHVEGEKDERETL